MTKNAQIDFSANSQNSFSNKVSIWLIATVLLTVLVILALSYIFYQNKQLAQSALAVSQYIYKVQNLELQLSANNFSQSVASTVNIANFDNSSARTGWVKYSNETLGLSFEYPIEQLQLKEISNLDQGRTVVNIILVSKKTTDLSGNPLELFRVSNTYSAATYGDPAVPESIDQDAYLIDGKKYDAGNFILGEGNPCGGGSLKTREIRLKNNLAVYKMVLSQEKNKDQTNCSGDDFITFTTPTADLQLVDKIISTIQFPLEEK